jgi:hypothetical protein
LAALLGLDDLAELAQHLPLCRAVDGDPLGLAVDVPDIDPGRVASEWLDEVKATDGTRPQTVRWYQWLVDKHISPVIGGIKLDRRPADRRESARTDEESESAEDAGCYPWRYVELRLRERST